MFEEGFPNFLNVFEYLPYMGIGMLGVFVIIGLIIAATYGISYFCEKLAERKSENNDGQ